MRTRHSLIALLVLAGSARTLAEPPPLVLPPIREGMGRIAGHIRSAGPAISPNRDATSGPEQLTPAQLKDRKLCGDPHPEPSLQLGGDGAVINALVWAPDGPALAKGAHPAVTVAVDQCQFAPHLIVTNPGAELSLVNRDALYHNVSGTGALKFSYALVLKGHAVPVRLKKSGLTALGSTNHPWMHAFVQVLPTTVWALTGADGSYFIDLPAGRHGLKVWQEQLGEQLDLVDVQAGVTTLKDFTFAPR